MDNTNCVDVIDGGTISDDFVELAYETETAPGLGWKVLVSTAPTFDGGHIATPQTGLVI